MGFHPLVQSVFLFHSALVAAHVPRFLGEHGEVEVDDPNKSWAYYGRVEAGAPRTLSFTRAPGERVFLEGFVGPKLGDPACGGAVWLHVSASGTAANATWFQEFVPALVPAGGGGDRPLAWTVRPLPAPATTYEPFGPSAVRPVTEKVDFRAPFAATFRATLQSFQILEFKL
jgi:hypothetical protein